MDDSDLVRRDIQERPQPRDPLFEKLSAVDESQRGPSPSSDYIRSDNGLSKCRGRRQYPGFVFQKGRGRLILFSRQFAEKACLKGAPFLAFVT